MCIKNTRTNDVSIEIASMLAKLATCQEKRTSKFPRGVTLKRIFVKIGNKISPKNTTMWKIIMFILAVDADGGLLVLMLAEKSLYQKHKNK